MDEIYFKSLVRVVAEILLMKLARTPIRISVCVCTCVCMCMCDCACVFVCLNQNIIINMVVLIYLLLIRGNSMV